VASRKRKVRGSSEVEDLPALVAAADELLIVAVLAEA